MAVREQIEDFWYDRVQPKLPDMRGLHKKPAARYGIGVIVLAVLFYYLIGALIIQEIDDDPAFAISQRSISNGQSMTVAMTVALLDREVNQNGWTANDPFTSPAVLLDNMPNYQKGMVQALGRFAFELADQVGRRRGSSQIDPDLQSAAGLLQYPGDVWHWDPTVSLSPTATSEAQYNKARRALLNYNERVARGDAVFESRADNLLATLDRMALDLGSSSAVIENQIENPSGWFIDTEGDDVFYTTKGQIYAYYMLVKALRHDFSNVIQERELSQVWALLEESLQDGASLQPLVIINGDPDSQILPSHLAAQGFYLLRARTQMRSITNILLK